MKNNEYGGGKVPGQLPNQGPKSFQATCRSSHDNDVTMAHKAR
jgi:hypothetical protein